MENRQQAGFDASLPGQGLLIWHIDEAIASNSNESHYKVALMQADGQRHLETNANRGDDGRPVPRLLRQRLVHRDLHPGQQVLRRVPHLRRRHRHPGVVHGDGGAT